MKKRLVLVKTVNELVAPYERIAVAPNAGDSPEGLLRSMEVGLHEMSQPMTALLCLLEYGSSLEVSDEMKQVMTWSTDAIERLRVTVIAMQQRVQEAGQRRIHELTTELHGRERSFSQSNGDCGEH
jgi:hypothetical protein